MLVILTDWLTHWLLADLTDVTLVSEDTYWDDGCDGDDEDDEDYKDDEDYDVDEGD